MCLCSNLYTFTINAKLFHTRHITTNAMSRLWPTQLLAFILILLITGFSANAQYAGARDRVRGNPTRGYTPVKLHPCEQSSCYPATGNLLIGRENQLSASSTCGLFRQQRYCIVSHLEERKKCFWCDSRPHTANKPQLNHQISNIVYRLLPGTRQKSWWQSENGKENVTIQLDLEAEFHFTHMIIVFKTFRPAAMLIERSYDFGKTWQVYRYFASNCAESFPGVREGYPVNLTDVVCESRYSSVAPSTDGEIIFRVLPPNLHIDNPYSQEVQNLLKMTNLRINFTRLHTLGDDLLDKREEIQEKYYYAISDMVVRGSCSCYGHANRCLPLPDIDPKPDMVHGRCECTHNTKGRNCEECEDFFNDLPWRPAIGKQTNACKRCNCNNHATSCHFDPAVYELSGRVSGGVCDGCKHNTMGTNCEQCKPYFYRDNIRDLYDPDVCKPCDCDPHGSLDSGICDSLTDESNSLEAGACHCKKNVEGRRCDTCKNGFWNFDVNNPDGCESCTCSTLGTIDNQGCDTQTGDCICKRYVTGRDCNQCLPEFWGLSERRDGCQPCDCDLGGALDNHCDIITGQCRCREYVQGRTCNQPKQHYFTGSIDFFVYEAESGRGSPSCQVLIREPYRDGRENTWSGTGFMRLVEGSTIEQTIDDIKTPMEYFVVLRYEPQLPDTWEEVLITIERPNPPNQDGPCRDSPMLEEFLVSLPPDQRHVTSYRPICLEPGHSYKGKVYMNAYHRGTETPSASILVDSISLIPHIETIPFFHGSVLAESRKQEYEHYRCSQLYHITNKTHVPDICKKYWNSIGFYVFNGAFACQCDPTGSVSKLCSEYGGHCQCKPNVVGRRCDRCAPGTYGFSPEGCKACDCNSIGALDNFCDGTTGQCKCRQNTYGRLCDQCQPGFWNFPNCQRCECNGHADICESRTGQCTNCRDWTEGHNCDRCVEGHYGDPRLGIDIPCRPCPCPGTVDSGHSYADRCVLDRDSKEVICECQDGYAGSRCDVCADNFYGNPEVAGGSCLPCNCSNNVDITQPGNCDTRTGKCLQCLFNTMGDHCEMCKDNFFRESPEDVCRPCVCSILGTNRTAGSCDKSTGQCQCLNNVIGQKCDACSENHWKIASGKGCEACDCDPLGSSETQCNLYDGQCNCKDGFGGRRCNECLSNHWGDPNEQCYPCECNPDGSETLQCERDTGACVCLKGIGGHKCDECARGYIGQAPHCSPCGECFDNWDRILQEKREQTTALIERAKNMKKIGAVGGYSREFEDMEKQLNDVKNLLSNTTISNEEISFIEETLGNLNERLKESMKKLDKVENSIMVDATQEINLKQIALNDLHAREESLKNITQEMKHNTTLLQEANVKGALSLIHGAKQKSLGAAKKVDQAKKITDEADRQCRRIELNVNRTSREFNETTIRNNGVLEDLDAVLEEYNNVFPSLNNKICDKEGNPCDSLCGGAGCGTCGGVSCENGALKKSENALSVVKKVDNTLKEKEDKVEKVLRSTTQLKLNTAEAKKLAQEAAEVAHEAKNQSLGVLDSKKDEVNKLEMFLKESRIKPADIYTLTNETLNMNIKLKPDQIRDLVTKIKNTLHSLTNIDDIIKETSPSLNKAINLKKSADDAKKEAQDFLTSANQVIEALNDTKEAQDKAKAAISRAKTDIHTAEGDLKQITSERSVAQQKANETAQKVELLQKNLMRLQENVLKNNLFANEVSKNAQAVGELANTSDKQAMKLQEEYEKVNKTLIEKSNKSHKSRDKANELKNRAMKLNGDTVHKLQMLNEIRATHQGHEQNVKELSKIIDELNEKMEQYHRKIKEKTNFFETC